MSGSVSRYGRYEQVPAHMQSTNQSDLSNTPGENQLEDISKNRNANGK